MWTAGWIPLLRGRRAGIGRRPFPPAVRLRPMGPCSLAAGALRPGDLAGCSGGACVFDLLRAFRAALPRSTAALDIPTDMLLGLAVFPPFARAGRGRAAAVSAAGGGGRRCAVFHRLLPVFAAGVGFLGGYPGIFAASDRHSPAGSGKFV